MINAPAFVAIESDVHRTAMSPKKDKTQGNIVPHGRKIKKGCV